MLDKTFSVGPPQKGVAPESKIEKDFRETSKDSKAEFERTLKDKMLLNKEATKKSEQNKLKQESQQADQEKVSRNEDEGSKTERKEKKSSGGIKKKMTDEDDDKMVSNIMASIESEVEIPESKIDLAEIEVGIEKTEVAAVPLEIKPQSSADFLAEPMQSPVVKSFAMPEEAPQAPAAKAPEFVPAPQQAVEAPVAQAAQVSAVSQLEQELGDEVGFQPDISQQIKGSEIVQKMKSFEIEKNLTPEKAQAFELAVLDQLKKQMDSGSQQGQSSSEDSAKNSNQQSLKDLKPDLIKNDSPQHAGQSHADFSTHLPTALDKSSGASQADKLAENYDKNIQELMSKANYLVTKGGGEMKVSMSPEGMGDVQLKVLLQDGKVNIEIQTNDKSVKKMIEDSLTELKSGLAAHRLSVEHVKIDTVNATNTDNSAQFQSNWNNGGSESKQREFWNQFQQNLGQQQQPARSSYQTGSVSSGSHVATRATDQAAALRTYGGTKGATVNRVA